MLLTLCTDLSTNKHYIIQLLFTFHLFVNNYCVNQGISKGKSCGQIHLCITRYFIHTLYTHRTEVSDSFYAQFVDLYHIVFKVKKWLKNS